MLRLNTIAKDKHVNTVMRDVTVIVLQAVARILHHFSMMLVLKLLIN